MNLKRCFAALAFGSLGLVWGATAQAQHAHVGVHVGVPAGGGAEPEGAERLDVSFPERGIVIGDRILAVGATFDIFHGAALNPAAAEAAALAAVFGGKAAAVSDTGFGMSYGARFGITKNLEVHAVVLPLVLSPEARYGGVRVEGLEGPSFGALFRFLHGPLEAGAGLDFTILTLPGATGVTITPGVPVRLHIGKVAALDAAVKLNITAGGEEAGVGLAIPVAFAFDITRPLHVAANSGLQINNFKEAGDTFTVPLGFSMGYAIAGHHGPILDIDPFFRWPDFLTPGVATGRGTASASKVNADTFVTGVEFTGYFYL